MSAVGVLRDLKAQHPDGAIIVGLDGTWTVPESDRNGWWRDVFLPRLQILGGMK